jgi:proteasome lid subunit RPN8/RPN11
MAINPLPLTANRLLLPGRLRRRIQRFAATGYPHEVCGLMLGYTDGGTTVVEEVVQARNLNRRRARDRYDLDPDDFLRAERLAEGLDLEVVGIWHSHPDHPPVPSQTDLDAAWPGYSYAIVSVAAGRGFDTRSWRLDGEDFVEEEVLS